MSNTSVLQLVKAKIVKTHEDPFAPKHRGEQPARKRMRKSRADIRMPTPEKE